MPTTFRIFWNQGMYLQHILVCYWYFFVVAPVLTLLKNSFPQLPNTSQRFPHCCWTRSRLLRQCCKRLTVEWRRRSGDWCELWSSIWHCNITNKLSADCQYVFTMRNNRGQTLNQRSVNQTKMIVYYFISWLIQIISVKVNMTCRCNEENNACIIFTCLQIPLPDNH